MAHSFWIPPSTSTSSSQTSFRSPPIHLYTNPHPHLPSSPHLLRSLHLSLNFFFLPSSVLLLLLLCRCRLQLVPSVVMGRALLSICLLLPLLFSLGHAALTFHDAWKLVLPHSHSTEEHVPDQISNGETTPLHTGEAGDDSDGGVSDRPKLRVDFGNKAWPNVYYSRRDRLGTIDWGTKSWPYIFYTQREDRKDDAAKSNAAASADGEPAAVSHGRKSGNGFRLY